MFGQHAAATDLFERAIAIVDASRVLVSDDFGLRTRLAGCRLVAGDPAGALADADRALDAIEGRGGRLREIEINMRWAWVHAAVGRTDPEAVATRVRRCLELVAETGAWSPSCGLRSLGCIAGRGARPRRFSRRGSRSTDSSRWSTGTRSVWRSSRGCAKRPPGSSGGVFCASSPASGSRRATDFPCCPDPAHRFGWRALGRALERAHLAAQGGLRHRREPQHRARLRPRTRAPRLRPGPYRAYVTSSAGDRETPEPIGKGGWGLGYSITKAAFNRMVAGLAKELREHNVAVIGLNRTRGLRLRRFARATGREPARLAAGPPGPRQPARAISTGASTHSTATITTTPTRSSTTPCRIIVRNGIRPDA
jgi:hypothetical protein